MSFTEDLQTAYAFILIEIGAKLQGHGQALQENPDDQQTLDAIENLSRSILFLTDEIRRGIPLVHGEEGGLTPQSAFNPKHSGA